MPSVWGNANGCPSMRANVTPANSPSAVTATQDAVADRMYSSTKYLASSYAMGVPVNGAACGHTSSNTLATSCRSPRVIARRVRSRFAVLDALATLSCRLLVSLISLLISSQSYAPARIFANDARRVEGRDVRFPATYGRRSTHAARCPCRMGHAESCALA